MNEVYNSYYEINSLNEGKQLLIYLTYSNGQIVVLNAGTIPFVNDGNGIATPITTWSNSAFTEGVTLVAGTVVDDPDGTATITGYQWYRNGILLSNETNSTYKTSEIQNGDYTVAITYRDAQGFVSTVTSPVSVVSKIDNGQGTLSPITSSSSGSFNEGLTLTAGTVSGDLDGFGSISGYQWYLNNTVISGATNASYALGPLSQGNYTVAVSYTDGQGFSSTLISPIKTVNKVDNGTGIVSITGNPVVGSLLTASQVTEDPEGVSSVSYTWFRNGQQITNANEKSYRLTTADVNSKITVSANYTDTQGYNNTIRSIETSSIALPPDITPPTVTSMTVRGLNVSLIFSEPVKGTNLNESYYNVLVNGVSAPIDSLSFDARVNNRLILGLDLNTAPTVFQTLTVAYDAPSEASGLVLDQSDNSLQDFTSRAVDTYITNLNIGDSNNSMNDQYKNVTLTGTSNSNIYANSLNNIIYGNSGNNTIYGYAGADTIYGGAGSDMIYGGGGVDVLTGNAGADSFYMNAKPTSYISALVDKITDFNSTETDKIIFPRNVYGFSSNTVTLSTVSTTGQLSSALLSASVFVYDSSTGLIYWNQNGASPDVGSGGVIASLSSQSNGLFPFVNSGSLVIA